VTFHACSNFFGKIGKIGSGAYGRETANKMWVSRAGDAQNSDGGVRGPNGNRRRAAKKSRDAALVEIPRSSEATFLELSGQLCERSKRVTSLIGPP
jgi:hypothetical protein